jgi:hypothetical protein
MKSLSQVVRLIALLYSLRIGDGLAPDHAGRIAAASPRLPFAAHAVPARSPPPPPSYWRRPRPSLSQRIVETPRREGQGTTRLSAAARPTAAAGAAAATEARRKELLTRRGDHFDLDPRTGRIEFGATAYLVTDLHDGGTGAIDGDPTSSTGQLESITKWLQDERGLAMSIWDPDMIEDRGDHVFRLQVMTLGFLTLQVAPWVDVEMKTRVGKSQTGVSQPVFCLQSIAFDPNVQILPGMKVTAESFGIVIEVSGQLRPAENARGVQGAIAFQTTGTLSPPMRLLPAPVLQAAASAINSRIVEFATSSFQKGARKQYREFVQKQGVSS